MSTVLSTVDRKVEQDSAQNVPAEVMFSAAHDEERGSSGCDSPRPLPSGRTVPPRPLSGAFASASSPYASDGYRERSNHRVVSENGSDYDIYPDEKAGAPIVKPPSPYDQPYAGSRPLTSKPNGMTATQKWFDSTPVWLGMYFFFNLGLTLFNKLVLVSFPFPYVSLLGHSET